MKTQITYRILRKIFNYHELDGLENIIMISNKSKRITFDNLFYRDSKIKEDPLYIVIKKFETPNTITFLYYNNEITVDECIFVYKDREETIPLDTMKFYFIEEIINDIADKNNFKWTYE